MSEYTSVESVFNEAVIEDLEEEALDAAEYGDTIDQLAGLSDVHDALKTVREGVDSEMIDVLLGDEDVMAMVDQDIAQDDLENEEEEDL